MAAKTTTRKPRVKAATTVTTPAPVKTRTVRVQQAIVITEDGISTIYLLTRIPTQIGGSSAWELSKVDNGQVVKQYHVLLNGAQSTCDCDWGVYGAHKKTCRHVASISSLIANRRLLLK